MSIITFWSDGKHRTEQTISMAAVATKIALERNYKILLIDTRKNDKTLQDAFWSPLSKNIKINTTKTDIGSGMNGLIKAVASNKISPEIITNYTKIALKGRLEILTNREDITSEDYERQRLYIKDIIRTANKYYDLVFVDVGGSIGDETVQEIISMSDLVMVNITQKLRAILDYMQARDKQTDIITKAKRIVVVGRYDVHSKYNIKNLMNFTKEKELFNIPYSTVFYEACYTGTIIEYIASWRTKMTKKNNPNVEIMNCISKISDRVVEKLKENKLATY